MTQLYTAAAVAKGVGLPKASEMTPLKQDEAGQLDSDSESDLDWEGDEEMESIETVCPKWLPCCQATFLTRLVIPIYALILLLGVILLLLQAVGVSPEEQFELFYGVLGGLVLGGIMGAVGEVFWAGLLDSLNKEGREYKANNAVLEERISQLKTYSEQLKRYNEKLEEDRKHFRVQIDKFEPLKSQVSKLLSEEERHTGERDFMQKFLRLVKLISEKERAQYIDMFYDVVLARKHGEAPFLIDALTYDRFTDRLPRKIAKKFRDLGQAMQLFPQSQFSFNTRDASIDINQFLTVVDQVIASKIVRQRIKEEQNSMRG